MNKQPICDNPINGCMETLSGYRLCCNPEHSKETNPLLGPVWHPMAGWPPPKPRTIPKPKAKETTRYVTHVTPQEIAERREEGEAICEKCGHPLGTCPRCQGRNATGERHCPMCDWCEACGRSGK